MEKESFSPEEVFPNTPQSDTPVATHISPPSSSLDQEPGNRPRRKNVLLYVGIFIGILAVLLFIITRIVGQKERVVSNSLPTEELALEETTQEIFTSQPVDLLTESVNFQSQVNGISFSHPSCLGEVIADSSPSLYGEYIRFSSPQECGVNVMGISLGREGIDRGGIMAGIEATVLNRETYFSNEGKNFSIITYEFPERPGEYALEGFYPKEEGGNEMGAFIVMMRSVYGEVGSTDRFLSAEEVLADKELMKSILETVQIHQDF